MQFNKVEICGVNTATLKVLKEEEKRNLQGPKVKTIILTLFRATKEATCFGISEIRRLSMLFDSEYKYVANKKSELFKKFYFSSFFCNRCVILIIV